MQNIEATLYFEEIAVAVYKKSRVNFSMMLLSFRLGGPPARTQVCPTSKNFTPRHPHAWETRKAQPFLCVVKEALLWENCLRDHSCSSAL